MNRSLLVAIGLLGAAPFMATNVSAQESYPSAPVKLLVGFAPGGATDVAARLLAQKLTPQMGVNVLVENRAGANTHIAADYVVKSKPDGHNLLFNTPSQILGTALGEKMSYDVFRDLSPVILAMTSPQLLFVHPSVPANNLAEFIAYARANPDKLAYGSAGAGSIIHLGALLFLQANGLSALHVPYKGTGDLLNDAISGRVQFSMQSTTAMLSMVKSRQIKALAIASRKRTPLLPDVPTFSETAMPGFEMGSWNGVMAPAKTPLPVIRRVNNEIVKAMQDAELIGKLAQSGIEPLGSTPEEYGVYLKNELDRWNKVVKSGGIKLE